MEDRTKLRSLLGFYRKKGTEVRFQLRNCSGNNWISGKITKLNTFVSPYVVIDEAKIFFEDIVAGTLMPVSVATGQNNNGEYTDRKPKISNRKRFEVLKRDGYSCKMCGAGVEAKLEVDHKIPVSQGGSDDLSNLRTTCFDCNRGKGDREA